MTFRLFGGGLATHWLVFPKPGQAKAHCGTCAPDSRKTTDEERVDCRRCWRAILKKRRREREAKAKEQGAVLRERDPV